MQLIQGISKKHAGFIYDGTIDSKLVGSVHTKLFLPANSLITKVTVVTDVTFTSLGSATVQVQTTGGVVLTPAIPIADLPTLGNAASTIDGVTGSATGMGSPFAVVASLQASASPVPDELVFTIAAAALTAGKAHIVIEYFTLPSL